MFTENLESFIYNSSVGIFAVSSDGEIIYANQYALETLGYVDLHPKLTH